jgi:acetate kinase
MSGFEPAWRRYQRSRSGSASAVRAAVAERLAWTGLTLGSDANDLGAGLISAGASRLRTWIIPTDEEAMIAQHAAKALIGRA